MPEEKPKPSRRLQILLALLIPALRSAAAILATQDENDTGKDDEAAEAINYALDRLERYQS